MKKILSIILCASVGVTLLLTANAHSGSTDENGGHWDRSTGEYHYHHGYPAHDHYDMDGDGIDDCPYEFDDKTSIDSGNSSANSYSPNYHSNDNVIVRTETITQTVTKEVPYIPTWVYWVIGILLVAWLISFVSNRWKKDEIESLEEKYRTAVSEHKKSISEIKASSAAESDRKKEYYNKRMQEYEARLAQYRNTVAERQKEYDSQLAHYRNTISDLQEKCDSLRSKHQFLLTALDKKNSNGTDAADLPISQVFDDIKIPNSVYFINGNTPVKGRVTSYEPFGDYTVYISERGKRYHLDSYCGGVFSKPEHLFKVIGRKTPCAKCAYSSKAEIPEWYLQLNKVTSILENK